MNISVHKTDKVTSRSHDLYELLDATLPKLTEGCVVAIATKIVSLCEGRVVPIKDVDKDELIRQEAQLYLPKGGMYELSFTIKNNLLVASAGVDESNGNGYYILWPKDLQASVDGIREHLAQRHGLKAVGVILTDSALRPLQWGTTGIAIAYSGFQPLKDYIGSKDLFGRELQYHKSHIANGLAAAAVTMMGEGNEQTPIALLDDLPFIEFQDRNPTKEELDGLRIEPQDDMFWPFLKSAPWKKGQK